MLESMRRNSRNIVIYVIFGILIAVFIISFGPQSGARLSGMKGQGGCGAESSAVASVKNHDISETSWRFAVNALSPGGNANGKRAQAMKVRETVMDALLVRELLAQDAEDAGFRVSDDEVADRVAHGDIYIAGRKGDGKQMYYERAEGETGPGRFTARALDAFAKRMGLASVSQLLEEERREMLAEKMRSLILTSVRVSPEEVREQYEEQNTSAEIEYVRFDPDQLADSLNPTAAEIQAYEAAHDADLKKQFDLQKSRYEKREKEVKLRAILVKKSETPASAPASQPAKSAAAPLPEKGQATAMAALARIKGGTDFAEEARKVSEAPSAKKGGEMGWVNADHPGLGEEVKQAIDKLQPGQMSDVVEVPGVGWYIVKVEGRREGTLTYDQVKDDLAEDALRQDKGKELAKAAADKALADAKAGTPLDKQFKKLEQGAPSDEASGGEPVVQTQPGIGKVGGYIAGIGPAPELVKELYSDAMKPGDLVSKVYTIADKLYVVKLTKRDLPDMTKFDADKEKIAATLETSKASQVLDGWMAEKCTSAKGNIKVDRSYVEYSDTDEKTGQQVKTMTYVPCQTLSGAVGIPQTASVD